ncbi:MAG: F0F1 ATP synthase subunit A [Acidimicrobiales bacterium]
MFAALEFPPIENLVEWPAYLFQDTPFAFNKVALISVLAMLIPSVLFLLAKKDLVPRGLQNLVESTIEFVENQVIMAAIGPDGMRYLPLLLSIFLFVFFGNIFEVIPTFQMPANARMANPMFLAIIVWVTFVGVGLRHHGASYFKDALFPPGVPKALYVLVTPIEALSTFVLRPFGLAVRLFANMLAGHILLVTFGVLCITLWQKSLLAVVLPFSFGMLVALTGFEIMVSFLQAFVFSLLAAVYIDSSLHPHH